MASRDFVDDAMQTLDQDPDLNFLFIGGHHGSRVAIARGKVEKTANLIWLRERFEEFYAQMEIDLQR
jgi:hypothetical protein